MIFVFHGFHHSFQSTNQMHTVIFLNYISVLTNVLRNISERFFFQIFCRCVTFVLNAFVVRHVGQAVLGVINVRLLLLESMILFLSREPFMKACLTNTAEHNWAQVVNLLWLTLVCHYFYYMRI